MRNSYPSIKKKGKEQMNVNQEDNTKYSNVFKQIEGAKGGGERRINEVNEDRGLISRTAGKHQEIAYVDLRDRKLSIQHFDQFSNHGEGSMSGIEGKDSDIV
ncbi:hypothetical protein ACH5RR_008545 [Cinchona calisaya]|uniref:Uncharacterized protein n=1 Tax=Cinchona calisaya TaxID=153742 RepID=A0ABD3ADK1_9GENT